MKKLISIVALLAFMAAGVTAGADPTCWDMTGTYSIDYTCVSGCSGTYPHSMSITVMDTGNGQFSGDGYYIPNPAYTWDVTGSVISSVLGFQVVYTGLNAGYTLDAVGAVAGDGTLSGTATAPGQSFTWVSSQGAATGCQDDIPEFTIIGAGLALLGAGFIAYRKRR